MTALVSPRQHLLMPWTVQEREDAVLEFERGDGVYFFDRQGRRYLDLLAQLFNCNLGHNNRRVIEAIRGVREHKFSYWDAQVWAIARLNQIPVVFTEDFNAGAVIEGIRFVNPFATGFVLTDWQ